MATGREFRACALHGGLHPLHAARNVRGRERLCLIPAPGGFQRAGTAGDVVGRPEELLLQRAPGGADARHGIGRAVRKRAADGVVQEVILATNFTNEGEATAHYIAEMLRARGLRPTRIARGVPLGGELKYVDVGTISQALLDRRGV